MARQKPWDPYPTISAAEFLAERDPDDGERWMKLARDVERLAAVADDLPESAERDHLIAEIQQMQMAVWDQHPYEMLLSHKRND